MKTALQKNAVKIFRVIWLGAFLLSACQSASSSAPAQQTAAPASTAPVAPTLAATNVAQVWLSAAAPTLLRDQLKERGFQITEEKSSANLYVDATQSLDAAQGDAVWTYALVTPFPTLIDNATTQELLSVWSGAAFGKFTGMHLLTDESTLATFTVLWGKPATDAVQVVSTEQLLDSAWKQSPTLAIIPFEKIEPKWKVLTIDGQSPIQKKFDPAIYPLTAHYGLTCVEPCQLGEGRDLSFKNYDPSKLTTVILTGVTALVRATAATMDVKGITYPGELIRDTLREADIMHINNEVPFYGGCPKPDPHEGKQIFCSAPRYIKLFTDVGADVIELSGDHFADYGEDAMYQTLKIYKDNNLPYYGGGLNVEDGRKPLLMESNGNKIMFIGCNYKTIYASATDKIPGSVPCDFDYMTKQIKDYRAQGYLPISTFQYHEFTSPEARPQQMIDFRRMADAGAVIVSGSQAHVPQAMEFYNGAFIHYGVGNLFFDQATKNTKREFLDRHVFYDGKYLGVELLTAYLTDFSRPRFMTTEERNKFLTEIFSAGGWNLPQIGQ